MSANPTTYDAEQQDELKAYNDRKAQAVLQLASTPLKPQKNIKYGDILNNKRLGVVAIFKDPELNALFLANTENNPELRTKMQKAHEQILAELKEYNIPPRDWVPPPYWQEQLEAKIKGVPGTDMPPFLPTAPGWGSPVPGAFPPADPGQVALTIGKHQRQLEQQALYESLGLDSSTQADFGDKDRKLRLFMAFNPRHMSERDFKHLQKRLDIKGDIRWVLPNRPELGLKYRAPGEKEYKVIDYDYLTGQDWLEMLGTETIPIAGDVMASIWGMKKLEPFFTGKKSGIGKRALEVLGLSGFAALGTASTDFLRLLTGQLMGAHDRSVEEIAYESSLMGGLAFAGSAGIGTFIRVFPAMYRKATGGNIPEHFARRLNKMYQDALAEEKGLTSEVDKITTKDMRDMIDRLADRMDGEFANTYRPTISQQAPGGDEFEAAFLKFADDEDLVQLYREIRKGNQALALEIADALGDRVSFRLTGSEVTGATVARSLQDVIEADVRRMEEEGFELIDSLKRPAKTEVTEEAGDSLLREVVDPRISNELLESTRIRFKEVKDNYLQPYFDNWNTALKNPKYAELTTGSGYLRQPATKWLRARQREVAVLMKQAEGKEASKTLFELLNAPTLRRLRGLGLKGEGGFKGGEFSLEELNKTRLLLSDLKLSNPNKLVVKYARDLEIGMRHQMNKLIQEGARKELAKELGIDTGVKGWEKQIKNRQLKNYITDNKYGFDLRESWKAQSNALKLSKTKAVKHLLEMESPEEVITYILGTSTPGAMKNSSIKSVMTMLEGAGAVQEINAIRNSMLTYIERNVLDTTTGLSPLALARNYQKFMKDHKGTLIEVFGDNLPRHFANSRSFTNQVIKPLEQKEVERKTLERLFGTVENPQPSMLNIIKVIAAPTTEKQAGEAALRMEMFLQLINRKGNESLKEDAGLVVKRFLLDQIREVPTGSTTERLSATKFNKMLTEGFSSFDVNPALTFENFIEPVLGKGGKEFISDLRILNTLIQREARVTTLDPDILARGRALREEVDPGINFIKRMLIKPLTQLGRRVTAWEQKMIRDAETYMGEMLLDPKLLKDTMNFMEGRVKFNTFINILANHQVAYIQDIGQEWDYYYTPPEQRGLNLKEDQIYYGKRPFEKREGEGSSAEYIRGTYDIYGNFVPAGILGNPWIEEFTERAKTLPKRNRPGERE